MAADTIWATRLERASRKSPPVRRPASFTIPFTFDATTRASAMD
jgi:hypothetical protein